MGDVWPRPVPTVGDQTSAEERAADPRGWAFAEAERDALHRIMAARRDVRRFRPDPVPADVLERILLAAHGAPSVGHSQPWRFVVVTEDSTRARAAVLTDRARLQQAAAMDAEAARHLLDLDLEGIREAPMGLVVCCDRRTPAAGVLGRATFADADMWSCACAIENLWLAARAEGLGVGWVTLFEPDELAALVGAPEGVSTLGWLCVGWPDERPPAPGLERRGWSARLPLDALVVRERWPDTRAPLPPRSRLAPPDQSAVVAAHDSADRILTAPGALGVLDRAVDRVLAVGAGDLVRQRGTLILCAADHPVTAHGVSAYDTGVTRSVVEAAAAGRAAGAVAAAEAGLDLITVDAGVDGPPFELSTARPARPRDPKGDLVNADALSRHDAERLVAEGTELAREVTRAGCGLLVLGEVGVGNTTVAAALAAALLQLEADALVGLGSASDSAMVDTKTKVVTAALQRLGNRAETEDPLGLLAALGGGELAVLCGVALGAAETDAVVMLDGMATCVAALVAVRMEPAVAAHLVAGQRSRETGHSRVLEALGLEPLLDLRLRAGEGVGAAMAVSVLRAGLTVRLLTARTSASA